MNLPRNQNAPDGVLGHLGRLDLCGVCQRKRAAVEVRPQSARPRALLEVRPALHSILFTSNLLLENLGAMVSTIFVSQVWV